jgi:hypothetical protein
MKEKMANCPVQMGGEGAMPIVIEHLGKYVGIIIR